MFEKTFTITTIMLSILFLGCIQATNNPSIPLIDANKIKALENKNKKLQAEIEKLQLQVGVYKLLNDCKEKALIAVIDKNSGIQQTTLKDSFERCDTVFSTMKTMAEKTN